MAKSKWQARWKAHPEIVAAVEQLLNAAHQGPTDVPALVDVLKGLPDNDVPSGLDLRGFRGRDGLLVRDADLRGAAFAGASLESWMFLSGCRADGADFTDVSAKQARFQGSYRGARFTGAKLGRASFIAADLTEALLDEAKLELAKMRDALLVGADLRGANLRAAELPRADLSGADLRGAVLRDAVLGQVRFDDRTRWEGADLDGAILDPDLQARVGAAPPDPGLLPRAEVDATAAELRRMGQAALADRVAAVRERVVDATVDWLAEVVSDLDAAQQDLVQRAAEVGIKSAEDYL